MIDYGPPGVPSPLLQNVDLCRVDPWDVGNPTLGVIRSISGCTLTILGVSDVISGISKMNEISLKLTTRCPKMTLYIFFFRKIFSHGYDVIMTSLAWEMYQNK